ncbi:hypothetical protein Taro_018975 [Colocasia esculenta]|uniref:Uncharacterized protein n=1 Tax=Colocasia esculenta TaxID=4460 RepID=A0A843USR5_COLES|nr:hypothetical protein [Colocasia esculenta]
MSVLDYEARFAELSMYAPHIIADERRREKKFVMGLHPSLRTSLVALDHKTMEEALSAACRQESEMELYIEKKKATLKRPSTPFQRQEKKKKSIGDIQVSTPTRAPFYAGGQSMNNKPECVHCGKRHGGKECWAITGESEAQVIEAELNFISGGDYEVQEEEQVEDENASE